MAAPIRTNPVYAHLAYQKTINTRLITFLRRTFIGDEITDPREVLVCGEVFQQDQRVPQEEVMYAIQELTQKNANLDLELKKFQLVAPIQRTQHEQKRAKGNGKRPEKGSQGGGQTRGH